MFHNVCMMTMSHFQEWQGAAAEAMEWVTQEDVRQKAGAISLRSKSRGHVDCAGASGHLPEHSSSVERGLSNGLVCFQRAAGLDATFSFDLQMPSTSSTVASVSTLKIPADIISGEVQDIANFGGILTLAPFLVRYEVLISRCKAKESRRDALGLCK